MQALGHIPTQVRCLGKKLQREILEHKAFTEISAGHLVHCGPSTSQVMHSLLSPDRDREVRTAHSQHKHLAWNVFAALEHHGQSEHLGKNGGGGESKQFS